MILVGCRNLSPLLNRVTEIKRGEIRSLQRFKVFSTGGAHDPEFRVACDLNSYGGQMLLIQPIFAKSDMHFTTGHVIIIITH